MLPVINFTSASPYISRQELARQLHMSLPSVDTRVKEIRSEIESGRYSELAVIKDGGFVLVNYLVFIDYMKNRQRLMEKNIRKNVEAYEPAKVAREIGWYDFC